MGSRAFVVIEDTDIALYDHTGANDKRIVKAVQRALMENNNLWQDPCFLCAKIFLAMVEEQKESGESMQLGITKWEFADAELEVEINCHHQTIVVSSSRDEDMIDCSFNEFIALGSL